MLFAYGPLGGQSGQRLSCRSTETLARLAAERAVGETT